MSAPPYTAPLFRRPSAGGGGLGLASLRAAASGAAASSGASAAAAVCHRFVWDTALRQQLESAGARIQFSQRGKPELEQIAKENYRLVKQGGYIDTSGAQHPLALPREAINRSYTVPTSSGRPLAPRYETTNVCVARLDTATAVRTMHLLDARKCAALNFANAAHPGGGYLHGARAQEEDLCRLIPTLFNSLKRLRYPLKETGAHFSQGWLSRTAGTYTLDGRPLLANVISAAMPNLGSAAGQRMGSRMRAGTPDWEATVRQRIRAVLHAAREERCDTLILGAFGCGAFGNPPGLVAPLFAEQLASDEFRGQFQTIVFAILEFKGSDTGNVSEFTRACGIGGLCTDAPAPPAEGDARAAPAAPLRSSSAGDPMDVC